MDTLDGLRVTNKELNDRKARLEDIQKARAEAVKSTESSSQSAESAEQGGNTEEQAPDDVSSVAGNGAVETNSEDAALTGVRANEAQSAEAANTETSEDESVDVGDTTPTLSNVVRILYNYGKKVAAKLFSQKFFDVAKTPDFMKKLGLTGGKFTIRYGVIARHAGKDEQHNLPVDIWEQLPEALQHPFAITKYYVDAEKKKQKGYRIYTSLQLKDGSYVVVGVEVRNGGRDLEVNSIDTVFGKRKNSELIGNDDVIYRSEEITPEQSSLLNEPNPRQYPTEQELSTDKGNETSGKTSVSEKKSESGSADTSYFPTDKYGVTPDEELSTMLLEIMEEVGATKENFVVDTSSGITDYNDGLLIDKDGIAVIRFEPNTAEMINGERGVTYAAYFLAALVYTDEYRHRLFDYDKREELIDAFNKSVGREVAFDCDSGMGYAFFFNIEDARRFKEFADKYLAKQNGQSKTDAQGNPLNEDGTLKVDVVKSIEELTDEDFTSPTRSVQLPAIPSVVDNAIGANGKPVIIKKNIFERNSENHPEVTPQHAREILVSALYRPDLYGQNQKARRPYNWIIINTKDSGGHNRLVVLEVNANKDNVEIVHWYSVDDRGVEKIKRQAQREGGHILILPSETEEAGALSGRQSGLSSESKDTETSGNGNQSSKKQAGEKQSKPKAQSKAKTDGEKIEDVGEKIAEARKEAKDLYERVLSGNFDELTLRKLNEYIDDATNRNRHYRPLSQRLPERALLSLSKDDRTAAVDALFSRICESTVPANGRTRAEGRRKIEARKEELLEAWANATGNWHESIADFTKEAEPIRSGTDSDVYLSDDGTKVIKASKGKFNNRKHPSDIDQVPLFNSVFPGSAYRILGYGRLNGKFVRFLEQPFVDFSTTTPVTTEERVEYMRSLGFEPQNEERTMFSNGEIVVSDLQKSNIVKGEDGNVWVIDADVKLHTKDLGGNYTYAPVETDTDTAELMTVYHGSGAKFDRIEFLRNGTTVYGAAVGGKILLNAEHLNPNTPVHEYTHLWDKAVQQKNPELWRRGVELMKQTSLWKEVENDPNYAGLDENGIASEVHSRLTGDKGAAELERMSREVLDGNGGIIDKASKMSVIQKLRKWLSDFWYWVKDTMTSWSKDEADKVSIEDFVNMPLADLEKRGVPFVETNNTGKPVTRFREDEIAAMETPILESKGAFKSLAEAEQWAKKNLQGKSYTNNFTNDEVYISGKSVSEMLNPKSAKKINVRTHLAALQSVPEFIKTGIPAEIHTDTHGRGYDVMRLYNAIIINDELYRVKSTVKRVPQGDIYYTYEIQKMELIEGSDNTVGSLRGTYLIPKSSSVNSISGAKLLKGVKKTNSDELILPEDEDIRFRTVFGGNSGYVGYSMSKRAAQAREEGRYPKTDFKKVYDIPSNTFDILVSAGVIDDSEWHHTSSWGNRTTFYKWDEWEDYEGADYERRNRNRDVYEQNRKEINNMVKAFQKELKEKYPEDGENPYNNNPLSEEATAAVNAENDRYYNELDNGVVNYDNWDDDQFRRAKAEHNERLKEIYDNLSPEDKAIQEETAKYYEWLKASVDKSDNREKARSEFAEKIKDYFNKKAEELSSEERDRRNEGSPVTNHLLSRDGMREAAVELSESLGVEVEFVRDSELPEGHRGAMGMWRNGQVYVCLEFLRRSTFAKENRTELFNGKCHHKCFKGSLSCETYQ